MNNDIGGSLEDQFRLNPVRLSMDKASFPVATKDMANILGLEVGLPIKPNMQSSQNILKIMEDEIRKGNLL